MPQVNACVLPAVSAEYDSFTVKRDFNSGAIVEPIITTYMHIVSTAVSVMIINSIQSNLQLRMQSMQLPANGTPSPEQRRIQKYFSLSPRIRITPQQPRHLMMRRTCSDAKRLSAWTKRSWTASGSNTSRGTASKTCGARLTFNRPQGSSLLYNKLKHAIPRAIIHNNPSSLASESAWKALVFSSWLPY